MRAERGRCHGSRDLAAGAGKRLGGGAGAGAAVAKKSAVMERRVVGFALPLGLALLLGDWGEGGSGGEGRGAGEKGEAKKASVREVQEVFEEEMSENVEEREEVALIMAGMVVVVGDPVVDGRKGSGVNEMIDDEDDISTHEHTRG